MIFLFFLSPFLLMSVLVSLLPGQGVRFRDPIFPKTQVQRDLQYGRSYNSLTKVWENLKLDLYQPLGDTLISRPAMVIVHGGGFRSGDKGSTQFRKLGTEFAQRGWVAISINYRLTRRSGKVTHQQIIDAKEDFKAAVRWLRRFKKTYKVDSSRIACCGGSAGAITCLEAAYAKGEGKSGNPGYSSQVHAVGDFWGLLFNLGDMEKGEAPLFIVHGTKDPVVPYSHALDLVKQAKKVGVHYELHPVQGGGHGVWRDVFGTYWKDLHAFLWEHLRLDQIAGLKGPATGASPGVLELKGAGLAGDLRVLFASLGTGSVDLGLLGKFLLSPQGLVVLPVSSLPGSPRQPLLTDRFSIPTGIKGITLFLQDLRLGSGQLRTLSNSLSVRFP
jgi:acetyl esterase/lipase